MMIIGERINGTRKSVKAAFMARDKDYFITEVHSQMAAGAKYIDLNAGCSPETELEDMDWLLDAILPAAPEAKFSIDSATPEVISAALKKINRPGQIINSATLEPEKYNKIFPLMITHKAELIMLLIDEYGAPADADARLRNIERMDKILKENLIPLERVWVDPLVFTLSTNNLNATHVLRTIRAIKERWPQLKTTCGLSNVSFGLPARKLMNRTFLVMLVEAGLDSVILDPLDQQLMSNLQAALALAGRDQHCLNYLEAFRKGKLKE